ncbi:MAG: sulfur oxidation c-type cytochrome SoxA [Burkholderiales bacterium]|nr:sulfur oxidation c-type cytochrome SoxA [Burkholderiales bacterium]
MNANFSTFARAALYVVAGLGCLGNSPSATSASPMSNALPKSGSTYASAEIRALQADDASNPGMLWVADGQALWNEVAGSQAKSCAQCHVVAATSMKGVATRYPQIDKHATVPTLINLEGRVNFCRIRHQAAPTLAYESPALLALTAYVTHQSRGLVRRLTIDDESRAYLQRGAALYQQRMGQMNLACTHCHDQNAGKTLLAEKISEGHPNGYPIYRLEWQGVGSLHRRFRSCFAGVRAEPFAPGSDEYLALELYLALRAVGLAVETPAVRR